MPSGHICDFPKAGEHPKKPPVVGGPPAANTVECDVPKNLYRVVVA
jgi:hypothetical protein